MLNPNQQQFCCEYAKHGNASKAYKAAYPTVSENAARVNACKLLKNPEIRARVDELQAEIESQKICDAKEIQERLSAIARREVSEVVLLSNGEEVYKPTPIKDSLRALEVLAKIRGMYISKSELEINSLPIITIADDL